MSPVPLLLAAGALAALAAHSRFTRCRATYGDVRCAKDRHSVAAIHANRDTRWWDWESASPRSVP